MTPTKIAEGGAVAGEVSGAPLPSHPAPPLRTDEVARRMGASEAVVRRTLNRNRQGDRSWLMEGVPAVRVCGRWLVMRGPFESVFGAAA